MRTVLVIDDNPAVAQALSLLFGLHDIRTLTAFTPQKGLAALAQERIDLVIADMNFSADTTSGEEGAALFRALRAQQADLPARRITSASPGTMTSCWRQSRICWSWRRRRARVSACRKSNAAGASVWRSN